jgi:hypothetical protein
MWSFLQLFQATVTLTKSWTPSPQREDDQPIMSLAILFTGRKGELRQINMCQIFLRAVSVSNITDFYGTIINQRAYDGILSDDHTNITWLNQQRLTKGGWG